MKQCDCGETNLEMFHKKTMGYMGLDSQCKACKKRINHEKYLRNAEAIKAKTNAYKALNRDKVREQSSIYHKANIDKITTRKRNKRHNDIQTRLAHNLRGRFSMALKNNYKGGSAIANLGCSIEFFKKYIESKWLLGMSWENYNIKTWHIDHIQCMDNFDLTDSEQVKIVCNYTNMQPLWAKDNYKKSNK